MAARYGASLPPRPANGAVGHGAYQGGGAHQLQQQQAHAAPISSVPDVPGLIVDEPRANMLRAFVARICNLSHHRFPGAQPVSFTKASLELLKTEDFWVCEKSDGQRVLVLIALNKMTSRQEVFLIDRKNTYREQHHSLFFPLADKPKQGEISNQGWGVLKDTLLDGELVWDTLPDGRRKMRLLLFDCIVYNGTLLTEKTLEKRYGRLKMHLYNPWVDYMKRNPNASQIARDVGYEIMVKKMELGYGSPMVLKETVPRLEHGNDGLIFTCITSGYTFGTDEKIIKWKPPSENTIDFKLRLQFPPDFKRDPRGNLPDFTQKPFFQLDAFNGRDRGGGDGYEYYDWMHIDDEQWEEIKANDVQFDDAIVECSWDQSAGPLVDGVPTAGWRMHRIRHDKHDGNHISIVHKIVRSIEDGVEEDELLAASDEMKAAWKSEERTRARAQGGSVAAANGNRPPVNRSTPSLGPTGKRMGPGPPMRGTPPPGLKR